MGLMTPLRSLLFGLAGCAAVHGAAAGSPEDADQRGRTLPSPLPVQRLAILNTALWPYLTMDQGASHVVGASSSVRRVVEQGLLGRIYPSAKTIPTGISFDGTPVPNVELLLAARPGAVLQWSGDNDPVFVEPVERVGLPVVGLAHMHREEDYFATNRLLATLAGKPERAAFLEDLYRKSYADLRRELPRVVSPEGVLYLWQREPIGPVDGGSIYSRVIEHAGGRNVAVALKRYTTVGIEQILAWNPAVIILFCCGRTNPSDLYADPVWSQVAAVRARRVYKVPIAGTRFADMVEGPFFARWLAELLYPEMNRKLRDMMRMTYADVYGYSVTEDELDKALQIAPNASSAGYGRFLR